MSISERTAGGDLAQGLVGSGVDWSFDRLRHAYDKIEEISLKELGLDVYPNQIEMITSEQMLDAYSSIGMPLMYRHWSFGKHFARDEAMYRHGLRSLAYEIVINSSPCISYIMEENSMAMQTLVIAHAAFGHNHFFKNNGLFRQWTDAGGILDYLEFAKSYIAKCEDNYGEAEVERVLDCAHALMTHGVSRYPRKKALDLMGEERRASERRAEAERTFNDLWRTLPSKGAAAKPTDLMERRKRLGLPEENLLYFLEKNAPLLKPWQRELLRIVRLISQYFYPQKQTKVMNEGCATFVHYQVMNRLHETGVIDDGGMLEFLHSHTSVVFQPDYDDQRYSSINPYALGMAMMQDIERICVAPTAEDREWFPLIAGNREPMATLRDAWVGYRDESFIRQFLSPALIRKLKLFNVFDDGKSDLVVKAIHDERGYRTLRSALADQFDVVQHEPEIEIVDVDLEGDRRLVLQHRVHKGVMLDPGETRLVLKHVAELWGYDVRLVEVGTASDAVLKPTIPEALRVSDAMLFHMIPGAPKPVAPYTHVVECQGFLFVTGQVATDPDDDSIPPPEGITAQTHKVMDNLKRVLAGVGAGLDDVVMARAFLTDFAGDYAIFNTLYAGYFPPDRLPARTTVGVTGLARGAILEIDFIARRRHPA